MSALTLVIIYIAVICTIVLIVWLITASKLHKEKINKLHRSDKVRVTIEVPATYLCRMDSNTHRIKIDSSVMDVSYRDIVKVISVTILLMLTLSGSAQYINLEWPMRNVKAQNRDKELIFSAPDYLEYKIQGGYIAYEFTDRICTTAYICLDSIAGCELIEQHEFKNWQPTAPNRWDYYAGYDEPVKVSADWYGGNVIFRYTLKD